MNTQDGIDQLPTSKMYTSVIVHLEQLWFKRVISCSGI